MFDPDGYQLFVREKMRLVRELSDAGGFPVSREIELQMRFTEERLLAKVKQAYSHASQELASLTRILSESMKDDEET